MPGNRSAPLVVDLDDSRQPPTAAIDRLPSLRQVEMRRGRDSSTALSSAIGYQEKGGRVPREDSDLPPVARSCAAPSAAFGGVLRCSGGVCPFGAHQAVPVDPATPLFSSARGEVMLGRFELLQETLFGCRIFCVLICIAALALLFRTVLPSL